MKNLLKGALLTSALLVTSANAEVGTVHSMTQQSTGLVQVCLDTGAGSPKCADLKGSADSIKTMTAMAMTAKSQNSTLLLRYNGGWNFMQMQ